jgi:hypothetical protein
MNMHPSRATSSAFTALALVLAALGCSDEPLNDLGYTRGDLSASREEPDPPLPPVAEFARDFAGVWIGAADDPLALASNAAVSPPSFRFPSGSARIRLELAVADGEVFPAGSITFGDAPPPPPATDPDVGYPIEPDISLPPTSDGSVRPAVEGFPYTLYAVANQRDVAASNIDQIDFFRQGHAIDGKLELSYVPAEVFQSWCALQTEASCPQNEQWSHDDAGNCTVGVDEVPMDCLKATQCLGGACQCFGDFCSSSIDRGSTLTIRFSEDGLVALGDGTFVNERGFQQPLGTIHFRPETVQAEP